MVITFYWAAGQQRHAEAPTSCMEAHTVPERRWDPNVVDTAILSPFFSPPARSIEA